MSEMFKHLFEQEDVKDLLDIKRLREMLSLKTMDRPQYEKLLEHIASRKPLGGWRKYSAAVDNLEKAEKAKKKGSDDEGADDDGFVRSSEGAILNRPSNVRNALSLMGYAFKYDEFSDRAFWVDEHGQTGVLNDAFINDAWVECGDTYGFLPSLKGLWLSSILAAARENTYHPVLDRLRGIEWDGKERIGTWLIDYLGADDTPFNRAVGALVLKAGCARVLQPGIKFDQALLLQGDQGLGKSTVVKIMALEVDWFTDSMPLQESDQKTIEQTQGKWIVEIGEMRGRDRVSVDNIKNQLSRTHDRARPAYGVIASDWPRKFIMIITANPKQVFSDVTGNRRYWPVTITKGIDLSALRHDMEQLWAEAFLSVGAGSRTIDDTELMLPKELWADANKLTEAMMLDNPYLEKLETVFGDTEGIISSSEVWDILGVPMNQRTRFELFGRALSDLGFEKVRRKYGGKNNVTCYVRWSKGGFPMELVPQKNNEGRIIGVEYKVYIEDHRDEDDKTVDSADEEW